MEIIQNFVLNSSVGGGIILDPFAGSGTTGVAAKNNDRQYLMFEKDKIRYLQAENRLNNIQIDGQMTLFTM
ncbi:MAG: site-specific DNA-methyltransferase [Corallococcus sp.]|nr:site-specific DNA-methyltransferase [Corallococcus sp.]